MIEPIGLVTILLCLISLFVNINFVVFCFVLSMLLGAASAFALGGSGNIPPSHVLLGAFTLAVAKNKGFGADVQYALRFPNPGFWLLAYVVYGTVCAILSPRVFNGSSVIFSIGSTRYGGTSPIPVPLTPTSGNINQSIYLFAEVICFIAVSSFSKSRSNFIYISYLFLIFGFSNIAFAIMDFITSISNTSFLLDPIRNADYDLHLDENVGGLRRIVGSFTETSLFSFHTVGAFAYAFSLWLSGIWRKQSLVCASVSLMLLLLSTSGTAYASIIPVLMIFYIYSLGSLFKGLYSPRAVVFIVALPLVIFNILLFVSLNEYIKNILWEFIDITVFSKSQSSSGIERAEWNRVGMENFYATYGIGSGFGSTRTSGWIFAVLSSTGVPGIILLAGFFWSFLFGKKENDIHVSHLKLAAKFGCIAYLVASLFSSSLVDLRLPFFTFAALACANTSDERVRRLNQSVQVS